MVDDDSVEGRQFHTRPSINPTSLRAAPEKVGLRTQSTVPSSDAPPATVEPVSSLTPQQEVDVKKRRNGLMDWLAGLGRSGR